MAYLVDIITYLEKIGFFDVMLPFILIFSIVFAILEQTKVLGTETIGDKPYPKRNLNLIVAFSIALFSIASAQIVQIITKSMGPIVILIFVSIFALMFWTIFGAQSDKVPKYYSYAIVVAMLAIFLWALGWLDDVVDYVRTNTNSTNIIGVALTFGFIALLIYFITQPQSSSSSESKKDKKDEEKKKE